MLRNRMGSLTVPPRPRTVAVNAGRTPQVPRPGRLLTRYPGTGPTVSVMRTQEVADQAGVNTQTLRYYERRGLLPQPPRRESGYRIYGPWAVCIVRFVKHVQQLGFSLDEAESLLELAAGGPENCDATQRLARRRMAELDRRIADLAAMRDSLDRLLATCSRPRAGRECPLLQCVAEAKSSGG